MRKGNDYGRTEASARDAMLAGRKIMERYSWEGQRALAEEMVAPWRDVLKKMGVEASVAVYTGSLSSAMETYCREDETSLVMRDHPRHQHIGEFSLGP